jgi:hypothetical protein
MSKVPTDPNMPREVRRFLDDLSRDFDGLTPGSIGAAGTSQVDFISGIIKTPANQDYRIVEKLPYAVTITELTAKTSSGTITATFKIDTTAITTGAISVTSTQSSVTPTALNVAAAASALVMTLSANSSAANLSFVVKFTRTLTS